MIKNVHAREYVADLDRMGDLFDGLGLAEDRLWPKDRWPAMRFDGPKEPGTVGGHGPVRYRIEVIRQGRYISFRFLVPESFDGTHTFDVEEVRAGVVRLRHTIDMRVSLPGLLQWWPVIRPLHNALVEDLLDRAEAELTGYTVPPRRLSWWVNFLKSRLRRRALAAAQRA